MITLPIGSIIMALLVVFMMSSGQAATFLNFHSFMIVVVGSLAVLTMMTPSTEFRQLFRNVFLMRKRQLPDAKIYEMLIALSKDKEARLDSKNPLIDEAQLYWRQGLDSKQFELLLSHKLEELSKETEGSVAILRNLSKYPPALGMTGTVIGLVNVFSSMSAENHANLGPALALALTATFYGLLLANALIMPLSDRIQAVHLAQVKRNERIYEVLLLIESKEPIANILKKEDKRG